jgi:hypothetical protein
LFKVSQKVEDVDSDLRDLKVKMWRPRFLGDLRAEE